jgi:hypothetical protein
MKPTLLTATNHDTIVYLRCDYAWFCDFLNTHEAKVMKKTRGRARKTTSIKAWFVRRVYKMRNFCGTNRLGGV